MKKISRSRIRIASTQVPWWSNATNHSDYITQQGIDSFRRKYGIELTKSQFISYVFSCGQMSDTEFILHLARLENNKKKTESDNVPKLKRDVNALIKRNKRLYGQENEKAKSQKKVKKLLEQITTSGSINLPPNWKSRIIKK